MWGPCLHVNWRGDNRAIQCKCGEAHNAEDARGLVLYGGNQLCREASAEDPLSGMDKTGRLTLIAMMCAGKKWQSCLVLGRKGKSRGGDGGESSGASGGRGDSPMVSSSVIARRDSVLPSIAVSASILACRRLP